MIVYNTSIYSSWEISDALSLLGLSHSISNPNLAKPDLLLNLKKPQKRWFHLTVNKLKEDAINILPVCYSEASLNSAPNLPDLELPKALKFVLKNPVAINYTKTILTYSDYVNLASRPSALTNIMTSLYKIKSVTLRKEISNLVFAYLTGKSSYQKIRSHLAKNYQTTDLIPCLKEATNLRLAFLNTNLADELGVASFDLNYLRTKL